MHPLTYLYRLSSDFPELALVVRVRSCGSRFGQDQRVLFTCAHTCLFSSSSRSDDALVRARLVLLVGLLDTRVDLDRWPPIGQTWLRDVQVARQGWP